MFAPIVEYNGTKYAYVHNLQGDIVAILDSNGTAVVQYKYDAWGRPISKTGSLASTLGTVQPFRYRGYVFDEETGLYYLRSRYYSTEWCRFINADSIIGGNFFAYCKNSIVNRYDPRGTEDEFVWPIRESPKWGTASNGEKMDVFFFVSGLQAMVAESWKYRANMAYGYVDCIGGARFMAQQFFKDRTTMNKNIRATVSGIRRNNLSKLEVIDPNDLEALTFGAVLFTKPDKNGKRHMGYYIGYWEDTEYCLIETTGKGDIMHYDNLEDRLYDPKTGKGFYEWGELSWIDYSGVCGAWIALPYDIPED